MNRNKLLVLFAVAGMLAALAGCSQNGTLTVRNDCKTEFTGYVADQFVQLAPNQQFTKEVYIGKALLLVGPKDFDITVTGSAWTKREFTASVTVKSSETTTYRITDDVGVLLFTDAFDVQVNAVSVKKCAATTFGYNLVTSGRPFNPGDKLVIQADAGCWDLLVNYGRQELKDTVANDTIQVGRIDTIPWVPGYHPTFVR